MSYLFPIPKGNMVAGRDLNIVTERGVKKTVVQTDPGGKHIANATARKIQELVKERMLEEA